MHDGKKPVNPVDISSLVQLLYPSLRKVVIMNRAKIILLIVLVVLFIIILLQNTHVITLNLLFWEVDTSAFYIPVVMVLSISIGYVIALFTGKNKDKHV